VGRADFIGGSDLHHLLSEKPYGCERSLWYEKRGQTPDYPREVTGPMLRGTRLEDLVADEVKLIKGWKIQRRAGLRAGPEGEYAAHIDRHIIAFDARGPGVLEIKTMGEWLFKQCLKQGLPTRMVMQLQWYIGLHNWKWGAFAVHWSDGWQTEIFEVERDEVIITKLRELAEAFWLKVHGGHAPEKLKPSDARCQRCEYRHHCQGEELLKIAEADTGAIADMPELAADLNEYHEACAIFDDAEQLVDAVADRIKAAMGDTVAAKAGGNLVRYKPQERWGWKGERMWAVLRPLTLALRSCKAELERYHAAEASGDVLAQINATVSLQAAVHAAILPYLETAVQGEAEEIAAAEAAKLSVNLIAERMWKSNSVSRPFRVYGV